MEEFLNCGYNKYNNFKLESCSNSEVILSVDLNSNLLNPYGIPHGGLIYSLADTACGINAHNVVPKAVTLNGDIDYLNVCKGSKIFAKSKILKSGKSIIFLECNIYDELDNLIGIMHTSYYIVKE